MLEGVERIGAYLGPNTKATLEFFCQFADGGLLEFRDADVHQYQIKGRNIPVNHWHQDTIGNGLLLVWSNRESTEFCKKPKCKIHRYPPGSILLVENEKVWHRVPPKFANDRCFIRIFNPVLKAVRQFQSSFNYQ